MYEQGQRAIDPFKALLLRQQLGVPIEWLFAGEELNLPDTLRVKLIKAKEIVDADLASKTRPGRPKSRSKNRKAA